MRLASIPLSLLVAIPLAAAIDSQAALHAPPPAFSSTLVDKLSDDPDYTSLLRLLQRAKLIPTLNRLNGSTFFAPTNDAIRRHSSRNSLWRDALRDEDLLLGDNVKDQLRQELFYHLLNYTVTPPQDQDILVTKTLHFPLEPSEPPADEPPPRPPWLPIPAGTLGGEPQRLRLTLKEGDLRVGVDAFGQGGAKAIKGLEVASNGILVGIDDILNVPPSLAVAAANQSSISYFNRILTPEIVRRLNETAELTVFVPVDSAWDVLHPIERLYLESEFATDDLHQIFEMHAVVQKGVKWSESFTPAINLTTVDGHQLEIVSTPGKVMVSQAELRQPDIYASNGVLHTVSSLLIPPGALQLTPEKFLLTLNCTNFISLIRSVDLTHFVNDTNSKITILAPQDDVLALFEADDLPAKGSEELRRMLKYHFLPGRWTPKSLKDMDLVTTELDEPGLDGGGQVLEVEVSDDKKKKAGTSPSIRFGGALVVGEPLEINNTVIYFISRPLTPPSDSIQVASPNLELSSFLTAVFSAELSDMIKATPRTSLLIPRNEAFKRLGMLVSAHLLSSSSKADLERVILHHMIDDVVYSRSLQNSSSRTYATLEGSDIHVERTSNGSIILNASGGWAGLRSETFPTNTLSRTGVVHELSDVLIPRSVHLTVGKLVKAAKSTTMTSMIVKAGMDWILNGTAPPEDSPWAREGVSGTGWTLLCPNDDAFKNMNLTQLYADERVLQAIVGQHLIKTPKSVVDVDVPNNNRPLRFDDSDTYATLLSPSTEYGDVVFREVGGDGGVIVGIKDARGTGARADWAQIVAWGRATTGGGSGGVIQIDRLLIPYQPPWWRESGVPIAGAVLGVLLIGLFFWGVRVVWRWDRTEATYEPSTGSTEPVEAKAASAAADNIKSFIAGGFGGISAVLVGHPFDLTKTRLQTAPPGSYTGGLDVVRKTLARDGATGLYRGVVPPILGVTPIFALSFWAYDASKKLIFAVTPNRTSQTLSTGELAAAGFLSAIPTTAVTAPVERAKVLLQVQGQGGVEHKYKGVFDVLGHLYKEGGIRSIYRGTFATIARDGPGSAAYFAAYEVTKKALTPAGASPADLNIGAVILAGGTAGVAMWAIAIPPDVLKSRIQSAPTGTYSGFMDCARKTIAQDGVKALWKGFGPAMARAFPANAATFLGVEASRKFSASEYDRATLTLYALVEFSDRIARNAKHFETWCSYQRSEQVDFSDIPNDLKEDVDCVFATNGRLPASWTDTRLKRCFPEALVNMILGAHKLCPELFSDEVASKDSWPLLSQLETVSGAWVRLQKLRGSNQKISEADFVANVYETIRSRPMEQSDYRSKCSIALPQPLRPVASGSEAVRILGAKTVIPDCAIFIPAANILELSHTSRSPFKKLKRTSLTGCGDSGDKSFGSQSTPCTQLQAMPGFEFASSFWEDKKPVHSILEDAYRQNRMSTTAAVRQLHSLHVKAPVFGLVWSDGNVRAHVDWCLSEGEKLVSSLIIQSAPYPGYNRTTQSATPIFHEWRLDRPADIIQVFLLIRNIDIWTVGRFNERVKAGVKELVDAVLVRKQSYRPWKRVGSVVSTLRGPLADENVNTSSQPNSSAEVKPKSKGRRRRS
ncbi:hypothetical protein FA95DRAFT_1500992 [Auriscalpium vulgare]|uniref:Uncharacterized protein n=1 Tax=Auriscalpium vulgare TaxID=40419 RepID=A0ACB8RCT9_9AGAM|nr:hypothetical protein FA95DRAFT_1500992 [Auriscalpium vulgare]